MDFLKSKTRENLARSFAGETQAGMRYQMAAEMALEQGWKILSDEIRAIAKNETTHAKIFFNHLQTLGGSQDNIDICAGYPFHEGDLVENLRLAAIDEEAEVELYPTFARIAREEGFEEVAKSFDQIANIESNHRILFGYFYQALKEGTLYKNESPLLWICSECGYIHTANEAWVVCPVCGSSQGVVEIHKPYKQN